MTSFDDGWECPFPWKIPSFRHFTLEKKKPTEKPTKTQKDFGGNILIGGTWRCKLGRIQTSTGHPWVLISSLDLALSWNFLSTTSLEHGNSPAALSMLSCTKPVQNLCKTCTKPSSRDPVQHEGIHARAGWGTTPAFSRGNVFPSGGNGAGAAILRSSRWDSRAGSQIQALPGF